LRNGEHRESAQCSPAAGLAQLGLFVRRLWFFEKEGFYEKEIARRTEQFGNIAHVWSIYESRHNENDPEPFMRGINSTQLFND
jgi:hypothetical protein